MVKKVKKTAGSQPHAEAASAEATSAGPGLLDSQFGQLVKESAQQIWSAGLAAFAKAQNNSGKAFDSLAAEGERLQKKTQASAEERLGTVASRMSDMAGEVGTRAGQHWDKLESIFEDRVARALHRLGAPSAKDLEILHDRLDALTQALQARGGEWPTAKVTKTVKPVKAAKAEKAVKPAKPIKAAKTKPAGPKSAKVADVAKAAAPSAKAAAPRAKKATPLAKTTKPVAAKKAPATPTRAKR
ncbi:phasin family protein [Roseateles sp. SL47]|uniref:phasin family protein n=1 Tax=Roseateles sp. SL47 TaxID=2995138 RepID=UPI00227167F7|nr:phasin family protein [Roseateles sp. SL47]WAC72964.1 phasin family protein [Roseateles sp. SL47]